MKSTITALCVLGVLCWATSAWAQGQGKGRQQRPARTDKPAQAGNNAQEAKAKQAQAEAAEKAAQAKQKAEAAQGQGAGKAAEAKGKAGKDVEAAEKAAQARGKNHQQQLRAFEAQLQRHRAKHMERQARLARIRELAVQKGDAEMVARVDKLIAKEQQVHERKGARLQEQKRAMTGAEPAAAPSPGPAPVPPTPAETAETQQAPPVENAPQEAPPQN